MERSQQRASSAGSAGYSWLALLLAVCAGTLVGMAIVWLLVDDSQVSPPAAPAPAGPTLAASSILADKEDELRELRSRVAEIDAEREQLEQELALLRASLVAEPSEGQPEDRSAEVDEPAPDPSRPTPATKLGLKKPDSLPGQDKPWFDSDGLELAGYSAADAQRVRDRWEEYQLDKLYLSGQAKREGYLGRPRYRREVQEMEAELRRDLGEYDYDAFLYATQQPNRVVVGEVLQDSPAEDAGFQAGDRVLTYAGERIYRPKELRLVTTQGDEGELVRVEVDRGGSIITLRLARGPLGIMTKMRTDPPRDL